MAVLTDQQRKEVWEDYMRDLSNRIAAIPINKNDLRAAFNAADAWADSNSASYNTALPQPARNALSASDKALILMMVVAKRWKVGA